MKKSIFKKLGGLFLGLAMGLGVAVGVTVGNKASEVKAATEKTTTMTWGGTTNQFTFSDSGDTYLEWTHAGGSSSPIQSADFRMYAGVSLTVKAKSAYSSKLTIQKLEITGKSSKNNNSLFYNASTGKVVTSGTELSWTTSSSTKTATFADGLNSVSVSRTSSGNQVRVTSIKVTYFVDLNTPVTGVSLDKEDLSMTVGESDVTLTATVSPTDATTKTVSWESSNPEVATVNASGLVHAVAAGNTTITVKTTDGNKTATCSVIVNEKTNDPIFKFGNFDKTTYYTGDTFSLSFTYQNINDNDIEISNTEGFTVSALNGQGTISGTLPETAGSITFKNTQSKDGVEVSKVINFSQSTVSSFDITETNVVVPLGGEGVQLHETHNAVGNNKPIQWSSSDINVATVDSSGLVRPVAKGNAVITAKYGTITDTCSVVVKTVVTKTVELTATQFAVLNGWAESSGSDVDVHSSGILDEKITVSFSGTGNTAAYWKSGTNIRIYGLKNETSGSVKFTAAENYIIKSIWIEYITDKGDESFSYGNSWNENTVNKSEIEYTLTSGSAGNGQIKITKFKVIYELAKSLESIQIKNDGTQKTSYYTGETFSPTGLKILGTYDDESTETIEFNTENASKFSFYSNEQCTEQSKLTTSSVITGITNVYVKYNDLGPVSYGIVVSNHTLTISGSSTVKALQSTTFSASCEEGAHSSYTWSASKGTINSTTGVYTAPKVTEQTSVTIYCSCPNGGSSTKTITVSPHTIEIIGSTVGILNEAVNLSATDDGSISGHNVSWSCVDASGNTVSISTNGSFTPTTTGEFTVTATCDCGGIDTHTVSVDYAGVSKIDILHNGEKESTIAEVVGNELSGFTAVVYDSKGKTETLQQSVEWSISSSDIPSDEITFNKDAPSINVVNTSKGGTILLIATSTQDPTKSSNITINYSSVSGEIVISDNAKEVYFGESEKEISVSYENFESPQFAWSSEDPTTVSIKEGEADQKTPHLQYNGVTTASGTKVTCVITDAENPNKKVILEQSIFVKASVRKSFEIINNGQNVTGSTSLLMNDNGEQLVFSANIVIENGYATKDVVWSLSDANSVAVLSQNDGIATITSNNKIAADGVVTLTATTVASDYCETQSKQVSITVKKSLVSITGSATDTSNGLKSNISATLTTTGNVTNKGISFSLESENENLSLANKGDGKAELTVNEAFDFGTATETTVYVIAKSDYDNTQSCRIPVKIIKSRVVITLPNQSGTIYEGQTLQLAPNVTTYGVATNGVTYTSKNTEVATVSSSGLITAVSSKGKDQTSTTIVVTSTFDPTVYKEFTIRVNREYIDTFEWAGGSNIEGFAGIKLDTTGWTFTTKWKSQTVSQKINPTLGTGDDNVHVYIADPSIETEPTNLSKVTNGQELTFADNGKSLVAFYKGYKCATTQSVIIHETINKIEVGGDSVYQKVTNSNELTSGRYLIVYEAGSVAFDSSLEKFDDVDNRISVTISDGKIASNATTDAAAFTFDASNGSFLGTSSKYFGNASNSNSISSSDTALTNTVSIDGNGNFVCISSGGAYLRYNSASDQIRFRYYKSSSYTGQKAIQIYKLVEGKKTYSNVNYTVQDKALEFARSYQTIMNNKCGTTDVKNIWSEVKTLYGTYTSQMSGENLDLFNNILKFAKPASYSGSFTDPNRDVIQEFASSYDWMTNYYGTSEIGTGADFLGRYALAHNNASMPEYGNKTSNNKISPILALNEVDNSVWVISAVALVGLTAIGGYFFYRKRKEI